MNLYTVENIRFNTGKKVLRSISQVQDYTGLEERYVKHALKTGKAVAFWVIAKEPITQERPKTKREKISPKDGLIAIKDGVVKYFSDIKSCSKDTGVAQYVIRDCITDGGSAMGWFFDYALENEELRK